MSVLTVSGTTIPDPTHVYEYNHHPTILNSSLPTRPASSQSSPQYNYTRAERRSLTTSNKTTPPSATLTVGQHHPRSASSSTLPSILGTISPPSSADAAVVRNSSATMSHSRQSSASYTININRFSNASSAAPRRSTSSRSTATTSPTSYVALMRKQKATVWCDRAQAIDPRVVAAQKVAKQRAAIEISSNGHGGSGRTNTLSSGGVVNKIRHGGVPKAPGYVSPNLNGTGVPVRLSANEMLGDEEEENRSLGDNSMINARTGSGKSSTNSAKYRSGYPRTPPSGDNDTPVRQGIPEGNESNPLDQDSTTNRYTERNAPQRNSSEDSFGELKDLSAPSAVDRAFQQAKQADDLRRRGSVDERAMSIGTGVRLFVANPD